MRARTSPILSGGKSATVLIDYLLSGSSAGNWKLTVVDADLSLANEKINGHQNGKAVSFDINDAKQRAGYIKQHDIVVSLMPPALHFLIGQ